MQEACGTCRRESYSSHSLGLHTALGYTQAKPLNDSGQLRFSNPAAHVPPSISGLTNTIRIDEHIQFSSDFSTSLLLDEWLQLDSFEAGLEISSVLKGSATEVPQSAFASEPINSVRIDSVSHKAHSCPRESYEILRDLICPSPYLHAPEANSDPVSAQLD
jgi:hypothetical protein